MPLFSSLSLSPPSPTPSTLHPTTPTTCSQVHSSPQKVKTCNVLDVLYSSLQDHQVNTGAENEVRYKLIIDPSEDSSLVRLLFSSGVLQREKTRVYVCSDFPGDAQLQKVLEDEKFACMYVDIQVERACYGLCMPITVRLP